MKMDINQIAEIVNAIQASKKKRKPATMPSVLIGKFVVVRTYSAGVHAGILEAKRGKEVRLRDAYRIWSWTQPETNTGSLSAVAEHGVGPGSKIGNKVSLIELTEAIEVIEASNKARAKIEGGKWA